MIQAVNQWNAEPVQITGTYNIPKNVSKGQELQNNSWESASVTLELSEEAVSKSKLLQMPAEMTSSKSRVQTISIETLNSRITHIENSLNKADAMNLSFGDRLAFLEKEGNNWVEKIKQDDPEMYAEWLRMNPVKSPLT